MTISRYVLILFICWVPNLITYIDFDDSTDRYGCLKHNPYFTITRVTNYNKKQQDISCSAWSAFGYENYQNGIALFRFEDKICAPKFSRPVFGNISHTSKRNMHERIFYNQKGRATKLTKIQLQRAYNGSCKWIARASRYTTLLIYKK